MLQPDGRAPKPYSGLTWESFGAAALWRFIGLLALLVLVLGVLTGSWAVALTAVRLALVLLLILASWLYVVWFRRQRAALSRRDTVAPDQTTDFNPHR